MSKTDEAELLVSVRRAMAISVYGICPHGSVKELVSIGRT